MILSYSIGVATIDIDPYTTTQRKEHQTEETRVSVTIPLRLLERMK